MHLQRLIIATVSLSLGLGRLSGGVMAQTNSGVVVMDDASGTDRTNRISGNCEISGSGRDRLVTPGGRVHPQVTQSCQATVAIPGRQQSKS
jgi:hypothetical protein